ncbi:MULTISPECIES: amino acid ABC transporter permease [unclassified Arthrobacter]|uniref:amino acid ABC transporter permease n=1 Tax=unclassified Arthrobacter TaxID=235627 RepID=UPI0021026327|nr:MULTISPECIES: amino acid ABC transporter permease [unclassified Arthrobacter]MCQ1945487.1 amino acid ABC transporter permease [Arthrobacter sp. zg-Y1116]MCQ1985434.1 amino acid ABC transporter permease [Arthrobacter sp. zg-Y844]MCQ1994852.1 amino acid ABC transporter permease [Arthrobacter sp. zg-Y1171]UWX81082.1 amino acid ABC transporter permease [Arthrobacter sp. zg-Y1171]
MSAQNVLFDAPGPKARRNIMVGNILGVLLIAALLWVAISGLADKGQFDAAKWTPFLEWRTWEYFMLPGLLSTLKAAAVAVVTSIVFGLLFGIGRLSPFKPISWACGLVVEFFRAVPVLLMMVFFYQFLSKSTSVEPAQVPFFAVVIALTLYNGSVIAELVRSGVFGLPKGQREAGLAIGLTPGQSLRSIEMPQALVAMLPALLSQFVVILKDSALGTFIGYTELLDYARRLAAGEGNILPALLVTAAIFIALNWLLTFAAQRLSRRLGARAGKVLKIEDTIEPEGIEAPVPAAAPAKGAGK